MGIDVLGISPRTEPDACWRHQDPGSNLPILNECLRRQNQTERFRLNLRRLAFEQIRQSFINHSRPSLGWLRPSVGGVTTDELARRR